VEFTDLRVPKKGRCMEVDFWPEPMRLAPTAADTPGCESATWLRPIRSSPMRLPVEFMA
jgi:hypothetical protein